MKESEAHNVMTDAMVRTPFFLSHGIEVAVSLPATEDTMFEPLTFTPLNRMPSHEGPHSPLAV